MYFAIAPRDAPQPRFLSSHSVSHFIPQRGKRAHMKPLLLLGKPPCNFGISPVFRRANTVRKL
jgi:hypothetical protein